MSDMRVHYLVRCLYYLDDSFFFFFSSRRRHTRCSRDWSSDVCSSDLVPYRIKGIPCLVAWFVMQWELLVTARSTARIEDRKSTRLNSSHGYISYAVFCLKKKNNTRMPYTSTVS